MPTSRDTSTPLTAASTRRVAAALAVTVLLDCLVQVLWKQVATALPAQADPLALAAALLPMGPAWLLGALFLLQLVIWTRLLAHVDLSYAQPLTSLSYLGVAALSVVWLGEPFGWRKAASIGLILAGVWLIGSTPMRSARLPHGSPGP